MSKEENATAESHWTQRGRKGVEVVGGGGDRPGNHFDSGRYGRVIGGSLSKLSGISEITIPPGGSDVNLLKRFGLLSELGDRQRRKGQQDRKAKGEAEAERFMSSFRMMGDTGVECQHADSSGHFGGRLGGDWHADSPNEVHSS